MPVLVHRSNPDDNPIVFWPTPEEYKAIQELMAKTGLPREWQILRQALRQYQLVALGHAELVMKEIPGLTKYCPVPDERSEHVRDADQQQSR